MIEVDWSKVPKWAEVLLQKGEIDDPEYIYQFARHEVNTKLLYSAPGMFSHEINMSEWFVAAERPKTESRKTVKDAVEYFDGIWPIHAKLEFMIYNGRSFVFGSSDQCDVNEYFVCTREEFEAEVKRREVDLPIVFGFGANVPLSFVAQDGTKYELNDCSGDRAEYYKAKPTISKAEAFDKINAVPGITLEELYEQFNVESAA